MPSFGRYEIESKLGEGAMGVVWRARDPILGRTVALKALTADLGEGDEIHQRFRREAEAMGRLSHPRIVTVFDLGEAEGQLYMAMEVLEGEDLRAVIARRFEVPLVERVRLMLEISEGVAYAHSRGVVHRDLKPANLFVTADGSVKILDFGLARLTAGATITRRGAIVGTPDYMSPEQAAGRPLDHRSDEFSLGAVFYELLTFGKPFPGQTLPSVLYQIISGEEEPILSQAPEVPARVAALVHSLLRKDPDRRPPDMDAVTRELREIHASLRRSGSRSALPLPKALAVAPPSEEARSRVGERLARARGMSAGARETIEELRAVLAVDPDCGEATELLWASLRAAWGAAPTATEDPALEARVDSLLARARPGAPAQQIQQALAELVLLAPDDPRVHDICRPKPS